MVEKNEQPEVEQEQQNNEEEQESESQEESAEENTESNKNEEVEELKAEIGKMKRLLNKKDKDSQSSKKSTKNSDELDYGQLAYLETKGVSGEEVDFVKEEMDKSGMELKDLLNNDYFQSKLKSRRDSAAVKEATPSTTRAGGESPSSKAEYWINKGEMPADTPENTELRREIVNKKMEHARHAGRFSSQPIVE